MHQSICLENICYLIFALNYVIYHAKDFYDKHLRSKILPQYAGMILGHDVCDCSLLCEYCSTVSLVSFN